jgi:hypothetical protein
MVMANWMFSKLIRPDYGKDEFYMRLMEECIRRWHTLNAVSARAKSFGHFGRSFFISILRRNGARSCFTTRVCSCCAKTRSLR